MKRVLLLVAALTLAASPAFAQAKKGGAAKGGAAKVMSASGTVSAVSADSITVKGKTDEWTFAVDKDTHVTAPGASHKSAAAKADAKATPITDFVKVGDNVAVKFHDMGATKHAASVTVTSGKPAAPKKK